MSTYHHLALFICHLFIDGHFRTAHFVYTPNTFDFDLLPQIDKLCPEPIPSYCTDITLPWKWPWNRNDNINNVLQLIFLNPDNFTDDIDALEALSVHYRVFCFATIDVNDPKLLTSTFVTIGDLVESKNLIVYHNAENVSVAMNGESIPKLVYVVNDETNFQQTNLFDRTFGEYERSQSIELRRFRYSPKSLHGVDFSTHTYPEALWMHFYQMHLNNAYIYITWVDDLRHPALATNLYCVLEPSNYYKELTAKYQCIKNQDS